MRDGRRLILVVDDDPDYLLAIRAILEAEDFAVAVAESGEDGLKLWRSERPDLLIVDLMMEEVDAGTNFVRELRAEGNTAPVIMASSVGDDLSLTADVAELGLAGLFQKPVDPKSLTRLIHSKLPGKEAS